VTVAPVGSIMMPAEGGGTVYRHEVAGPNSTIACSIGYLQASVAALAPVPPGARLEPDASPKEDQGLEQEYRDQDGQRPQHVPAEARHLDPGMLGDGLDHEIRTIADVGVGTHEH
jgi:hypothetical protein